MGMALDIDRYWQTGDVAGDHINMNGQGGRPSAISRGSDPQVIDPAEDIGLYLCQFRIGMSAPDRAQEGLLGDGGCLIKGTADPNTNDDGGTWVRPRLLYLLNHKLLDPLKPRRRSQHLHPAHVLTATPLREDNNFNFVPRDHL